MQAAGQATSAVPSVTHPHSLLAGVFSRSLQGQTHSAFRLPLKDPVFCSALCSSFAPQPQQQKLFSTDSCTYLSTIKYPRRENRLSLLCSSLLRVSVSSLWEAFSHHTPSEFFLGCSYYPRQSLS